MPDKINESPSNKLLQLLRRRDFEEAEYLKEPEAPTGEPQAPPVQKDSPADVSAQQFIQVPEPSAPPLPEPPPVAEEISQEIPEIKEKRRAQTIPMSPEEEEIFHLFSSAAKRKDVSPADRLKEYVFRWFKSERFVYGIDVGASSIKVIKISYTKKGPVLSHFALLEFIHDESHAKGVPQKEIEDTIATVMNSKDIGAGKYIISVSGSQTALRKLTLPNMNSKEMEQAVVWQAGKNLPFQVATSELDWHLNPEPTIGETSSITVFAAEKSFLNANLALFDKAGISVDKVTSPQHALLNIVERVSEDGGAEPSVVIEIGYDSVSICFIAERTIQFKRDIPVGVSELVEGLQGQLMLSGKKVNVGDRIARQIIAKYGIPLDLVESYVDENVELNPISQQMGSSVDRFVDEITRSLDYYGKKFPDNPAPQTIYISGGGGNILHIGYLIKKVTGKKVLRLNPLFDVEIPEEVISPEVYMSIASSLTIAGGLALDPPGGVNLAPDEIKEKVKLNVVKRAFAIAAALIGVTLGGLTVSAHMELNNLNEHANEARDRLAALSPVQQQYLKAEREKNALTGFTDIMKREANIAAWCRAQLKMLSMYTPPKMLLQRIDIQSNVSVADRARGVPNVQISGAIFADDSFSDLILNDFLKALGKSQLYKEVEVAESNISGSGRGRALFFLLNCYL